MKTCKYGCGKMSEGGKVATIKKMKLGGTTDSTKGSCPDGQYWSVQGCIDKMPGHKGPFSSTSSKIGAGTLIGGLLTSAGAKIGQKIKAKQANKKAAEEAANTPVAKFTKSLNNKLITKKMGGQTIVGMPIYNATTRPMQMKSGGATKNAKLAAVAPPRNKVTRADVLTRILKKKKK